MSTPLAESASYLLGDPMMKYASGSDYRNSPSPSKTRLPEVTHSLDDSLRDNNVTSTMTSPMSSPTKPIPDQSPPASTDTQMFERQNQVSTVMLYNVPIVCLRIDNMERLCLAQISNTLLKDYSYNEIHNRRVALGITCVQCTPVQLEILRRAGAMPISSRRCGMITKREAERLVRSFLEDTKPPKLPDNFAFQVIQMSTDNLNKHILK